MYICTIVVELPVWNLVGPGSVHDTLLPAKVESEKSGQEKSQKASEGDEQRGENKAKSVKKKRKQRSECVEDGEQPGPSCPQTPAQRTKKRKLRYCEFFSAMFLLNYFKALIYQSCAVKTSPTSWIFALGSGRCRFTLFNNIVMSK